MIVSRYSAITDHRHETYEFLSEGPKGTVKKVVQYLEVGPNVYNLAFGDWHEEAQEIRDDTRTNNADRDKVLATVAATAIDFMAHHPGAVLYAEGSTPARTRLYQMGILANAPQIDRLFQVLGLAEEGWEDLVRGKNYEAFALKGKEKM
jgi:hypothetical protein